MRNRDKLKFILTMALYNVSIQSSSACRIRLPNIHTKEIWKTWKNGRLFLSLENNYSLKGKLIDLKYMIKQ